MAIHVACRRVPPAGREPVRLCAARGTRAPLVPRELRRTDASQLRRSAHRRFVCPLSREIRRKKNTVKLFAVDKAIAQSHSNSKREYKTSLVTRGRSAERGPDVLPSRGAFGMIVDGARRLPPASGISLPSLESRGNPPPGGWLMGAAFISESGLMAREQRQSLCARGRASGRAYRFFWNQLTTDFSRLIFFWSCSSP